MNIKPWQESYKDTNISSDDIQIYSAFFDEENSSQYILLLSDDEKVRAARLKNRKTACQQIISRGILRLLLGNCIGINPKVLAFNNNPIGKPFLSYPADSEIYFNLAHSGNLLLIAVGKGKHVGIDVEKIEGKIDFKGISSLVFSFDEQLSLSHSTDPIHDFYRIWTAKEAILKGTGLGFSYPSKQFSVVISNRNAVLFKVSKEFAAGSYCLLSSFSPVNGYSAALAVLH